MGADVYAVSDLQSPALDGIGSRAGMRVSARKFQSASVDEVVTGIGVGSGQFQGAGTGLNNVAHPVVRVGDSGCNQEVRT